MAGGTTLKERLGPQAEELEARRQALKQQEEGKREIERQLSHRQRLEQAGVWTPLEADIIYQETEITTIFQHDGKRDRLEIKIPWGVTGGDFRRSVVSLRRGGSRGNYSINLLDSGQTIEVVLNYQRKDFALRHPIEERMRLVFEDLGRHAGGLLLAKVEPIEKFYRLEGRIIKGK